MRLSAFSRAMRKPVFTFAEARLVSHEEPVASVRLNLHRWVRRGDLIRLRREVYAFRDRPCPLSELITALYPPAYVSLESALNQHGLLPDVPFEVTLVTPRPTRSFQTPLGRFHFHRIHTRLFFGYDSRTLLADPEKALLDYLYFRGAAMRADPAFWRESRLQQLHHVNWRKGDEALKAFGRGKVRALWRSLEHYAKTHRTT